MTLTTSADERPSCRPPRPPPARGTRRSPVPAQRTPARRSGRARTREWCSGALRDPPLQIALLSGAVIWGKSHPLRFNVIHKIVLRSVMGQPLFSFSENGDRGAVGLACQDHRIGIQSHAPHSRTRTIIRGGRAKQKGKMQLLLS
ncbi:hypothetical protein MJT46_012290 [Ovis ammon polii x Ovis aries]|uniref:Uncharacterized protein n=1 Tax=Ovis aries TaxID=9940 RepID=A0A836CUH4_SHEEP|nr:hypothetical protein JEQ12_007714 [Ovis aries]KAI4560052.1 hypothetical protein MJT46_012290 [Ovis ammon polii x Ovis aries]